MKMFALALGLFAVAGTASADSFSYPDFDLTNSYEKSVVAKDVQVVAYAKRLGATAFKVKKKSTKLVYGVVTNNGCSFDAKVVYNDWPGVDAVEVLNTAICR